MFKGITKLLKDNRSFFLFISLMLVFRSAVADWNTVPSGSMLPTIVEGDRILVNKMAYDLRVPFTHIALVKLADPARGDIVVFDSKKADKKLIKRVIAVPGDTVMMRDNRLYLNGEPLSYTSQALSPYAPADVTEMQENLLGMAHSIRLNPVASRLANFGPVTVPDAHYLALGDNRDNSADSRVIGFVPRDEIVGRSSSVVFSLDYDDHYLPRPERLMREF
ncbi:signal peptidase I [Shewanella baltica]|uniref:signal peptidase I n=1 Tax=Shewanella baltica TaxID=62322 RepID=UPI00217E6DB6|nr:signal peptidase I [Shewanella baltica]MCS6155274.1 signal peptidase I [Shewanella baltica]